MVLGAKAHRPGEEKKVAGLPPSSTSFSLQRTERDEDSKPTGLN